MGHTGLDRLCLRHEAHRTRSPHFKQEHLDVPKCDAKWWEHVTTHQIYQLEFTEEYAKEVDEIYHYVSEKLHAKEPAKELVNRLKGEN